MPEGFEKYIEDVVVKDGKALDDVGNSKSKIETKDETKDSGVGGKKKGSRSKDKTDEVANVKGRGDVEESYGDDDFEGSGHSV